MDRRLIWQLAFRYLRGKRSANAVPILSRISMVAIAVSAAAMIVIFSVFNGLESLVKEKYSAFYPDMKVSAGRGKFFSLSPAKYDAVKHLAGIQNATAVMEDNVLAISNGQQIVMLMKGITNDYFQVNDIREYITGADTVSAMGVYTAIGGSHIMNVLGADINAPDNNIELYYPNTKTANPSSDIMEATRSLKLHPAGIFKISEEFDGKYILAPLFLVQDLFQEQGKYSSLEIKTEPGSEDNVKKSLQQLFGSGFRVETRYEQNRTTYSVMSTEKWAVVAILIMVMLIAGFNMVGALSMLVMEKQKDIAILRAMGAMPSTIRKIFMLEGILWSLSGGLSGVIIGTLLSLAQQYLKIIKLGDNFLVDAFPVQMQLSDLGLVICIVIGVGLLVSWYPALRATKVTDPTLKSA